MILDSAAAVSRGEPEDHTRQYSWGLLTHATWPCLAHTAYDTHQEVSTGALAAFSTSMHPGTVQWDMWSACLVQSAL